MVTRLVLVFRYRALQTWIPRQNSFRQYATQRNHDPSKLRNMALVAHIGTLHMSYCLSLRLTVVWQILAKQRLRSLSCYSLNIYPLQGPLTLEALPQISYLPNASEELPSNPRASLLGGRTGRSI